MLQLDFVHADTGATIGSVPNAPSVPLEGTTVTLEHAVYGPVHYRVAAPADHWYRARSGRLAKPDQYAAAAARVYVRPVEDLR